MLFGLFSAVELSNHMHSQPLSTEIILIHVKINLFSSKLRSALDIIAPEKTKNKS